MNETIKRPQMILFDFGGTLAIEKDFDDTRGAAKVLEYAVKNPYNHTPEDVHQLYQDILKELKQMDPKREPVLQLVGHSLAAYMYQTLGIEFSLTPREMERIFWDAAGPATLTEGIGELLNFLREQNIRTGVISNIMYAGELVEERINRLFPDHTFEFIISTSEYLFKKPYYRIFDLGLKKAGLQGEDVWYCGDSYEIDVIGSGNAGLIPVWYLGSGGQGVEETVDVLKIRHWDELQRLLAQ